MNLFNTLFKPLYTLKRFQVPVEKRHVMPSPIMIMKSEKNPTEKDGMRRAHIRDAAAFCDFMAYLEEKVT